MENMDIQIIKSRRRTVSIEVHTDGSVILRAPNRITKKELDIFIDATAFPNKSYTVALFYNQLVYIYSHFHIIRLFNIIKL